jgi:hypothetical protein
VIVAGLPNRIRSSSITSTFLPHTLASAISPLSSETCPLVPDLTGFTFASPSPRGHSVLIDEFGRRCATGARNVSGSTVRSNILDQSFADEEDGQGDWTLKLREADEAHLDDL